MNLSSSCDGVDMGSSSDEVQLYYALTSEMEGENEKIDKEKTTRYHSLWFVVFGMVIMGSIICSFGLLVYGTTTPNIVLPENQQIINAATEFQVPLSFDTWENRDNYMKTWMEMFEKQSAFFTMKESEIASDVRTQFFVDTSACKVSREIRVRNYLEGTLGALSTVEIKGNPENLENCKDFPFWPNPDLQNVSSQLCQKVQHPCDYKNSRNTLISLEQAKTYKTCLDIVEFFPYAFNDLSVANIMNAIKVTEADFWFVQEYKGTMNHDTEYRVSFKMKYSSLEQAKSEFILPHKGEWTIRLYSLDGVSPKYNPIVVLDIKSAWEYVQSYFSQSQC